MTEFSRSSQSHLKNNVSIEKATRLQSSQGYHMLTEAKAKQLKNKKPKNIPKRCVVENKSKYWRVDCFSATI